MLSKDLLNKLHNEFNEINDLEYTGLLMGDNSEFKVIKIEDNPEYLNTTILIYNKDNTEIDMWCVSLNKKNLELSLDYMYNLVDCMDIDYANRKPILEWIYQSMSYENIVDTIKKLIEAK